MLQGDHVFLQDLQSRNGSFVNGAKVSSANLQHGDVIAAGRTQFQIVLVASLPGEKGNPSAGYDDSLSGTGVDMPGYSGYDKSGAGRSVNSPLPPTEYDRTEAIPPEQNPYFQGKNAQHDSTPVQSYQRLSSQSFQAARKNAGLGSATPAQNAPQASQPPAPPSGRQQPRSDNPFARSTQGAEETGRSTDWRNHPQARPQGVPQQNYSHGLVVRYESRMAPSGMTYFCPCSEIRVPTDIAELIGQGRNLYAVINFSRLPYQDQAPIYHECVAGGAVQISRELLLIQKREDYLFNEILRKTWGSDATICVSSRLGKMDFANHTARQAQRLESPSVLLNQLYADGQYSQFGSLDGISAVMLEIERGARWIIFKNDSEIRTWRTLGLPCPPQMIS